jgi:protein gp37
MSKRLKGRFGYDKQDPFQPTFHPDKLKDPEKLGRKPKRIFVCSMGDIFSEGVEPGWVHQVLDTIDEVPQHHFLVLTKRPDRIQEMLHCVTLPENLWLGVSVTCQKDTWRIGALRNATAIKAHRFVSFEPLHSFVKHPLQGLEWAIIGAETGNRRDRITPAASWIESLAELAINWDVPLFIKDNALRYCPPTFPTWDKAVLQRFPEALHA